MRRTVAAGGAEAASASFMETARLGRVGEVVSGCASWESRSMYFFCPRSSVACAEQLICLLFYE